MERDRLKKRSKLSVVDEAVNHLRGLIFASDMDKLRQVALYLLETFFEGDVERALSLHAQKEHSLGQLAKRSLEFGMTSSGVMKAIPVSLQFEQLGPRLGNSIGYTHHIALLPVKALKDKKELAEEVEANGYTVKQLKARIRERQEPHAGGRPAAPPLVVFLGRTTREMAMLNPMRRLGHGLARIPRSELEKLFDQAKRLHAAAQKIEEALLSAIAASA